LGKAYTYLSAMATPLVLDVHASVANWDDMEKIYHHMFYNELRVAPEETPTLVTENPRAPKSQREKLTQIFFETFSVPAFYLSISGLLALYGAGRLTGLAVDMGHLQTWIIPAIEGNALHEHINLGAQGGNDVTERLMEDLNARGYSLTTTAERVLVVDIKEKLCYVALNASKERSKGAALEKTYELPDGQLLNIGQERFSAPEILFQGDESLGDKVVQSMLRCKENTQFMARNVVLCGGNSMFEGLPLRIKKELQSRLNEHDLSIRVLAPPERKTLPWIGGSIMTSLSSFQRKWISKEYYDELGPSAVHRFCPN